MQLKRIARTVGATALGGGATALMQLIGVPLYVRAWGASQYGEWLVLTTIPLYLLLAGDLGLGAVTSNDMTMRLGRGDRPGALASLQSSWVFMTASSVLVFALGAALVFGLPFEAWLNVERIGPEEARLVVVLLLGALLVFQQDQLVAAGIRCNGAFAQEALFSSGGQLVEFAGVATLLLLGGSPVAVAGVMLGARVATLLAKRVYLARRYPWVQWGVRHARVEVVRGLVRPAAAYMGLALNYAFAVQGVLTVTGAVLGPYAVTVVATTRTLLNGLRLVLGVFTASIRPELSQAYGAGRLDEARRIHRFAVGVTVWVSLAAGAVMMALGPVVFALWLGGEVPLDRSLFHLLLGATLLQGQWSTTSSVLFAINRMGRLAVANLASSALVVAAALLTPRLGLGALGGAQLLADAVMAVYILHLAAGDLGDRPGAILRAAAMFPATAAARLRRSVA